MALKSSFRQNYRTTFSPTVPTSAAGISHVADVGAPGGEKWEHLKKSGGKQWQTTPKNLPRMQRTRAIPVAWLSSGLCPDRPKGWLPIIIIIKFYMFWASFLPIARSSPLYIRHWWVPCRFLMTVSRRELPSWHCLETVNKNLHETYQCRMYSG